MDNIGNFIFMLIQTVVFLIPVVILFYKFGRRDQILDEAVRDINGLGGKVAVIRDDHNKALYEVTKQLIEMNNTLIGVNITINYIKKEVEELKK